MLGVGVDKEAFLSKDGDDGPDVISSQLFFVLGDFDVAQSQSADMMVFVSLWFYDPIEIIS